MKHKEKHRVLEERFQKVGESKKLPSKFWRVREQFPQPNTVAVLCRVMKRKWGWLQAQLPESNAGITGETSKSETSLKSIIWDREFLNYRKVLEGKARKLWEQGKGKWSNQSRSLTKEEEEEEEVLWQNGQLGGGTPWALHNTMWWLPTQHFGLQEWQEHHQMKVDDFTSQDNDDGNKFVTR